MSPRQLLIAPNSGRPAGCAAAELEALETEVLAWHSFWGGYGPDGTSLEQMENEQPRASIRGGSRALKGIIARDFGKQCSTAKSTQNERFADVSASRMPWAN